MLSKKRFDPEVIAFELTLKLYRVAEQNKLGKLEAISRRGKELPQLIAQIGLVPSIAFYMSKSNRDNYRTLYSYLAKGEATQQLTDILKEEGGREGKGYTVLLALTGSFIKEAADNEIVKIASCKDVDSIAKLAQCLKEVREEGEESVLEKYTLQFLMTLKRLLEALFG